MDRYERKKAANMQRLNGEIRKAAKAAKRHKWLDRKEKRRSRPKRTFKTYGADDD